MRVYQKVLSFMALVILFSHKIQALTCDSISPKLMEQTWQEFRAIHPFGFQTVGLKHFGDTCVFVMSEPNNWVKENDLRQLFDKYDGQLTTRNQLYGIGGQLIDAVGCAKLDSIQFLQLEKELFNLLYRSDYKPYYTDLDHPVEHIYFSDNPLNHSFSWERLKSTRLLVQFPNDSICEMSFPRLCDYGMTKTNDIFFSKHRGFIVWVIADNIDYQNDSSFLVNARKFALDSDLICGTFRSMNRIAVIGREREVPVNILPPLRSETILSLASTKKDISLVFNKDSIKVINDTLYATPINMSNMLNDTELGNLMVMTDFHLKSWSENGKVKDYIINHPQPISYPFPYGVTHELGDSTRLLWNFEIVEADYPGFCPVIRTGSLSPMYWSANNSLIMKQNAMNNVAFNYFARLNCPDLVRIKSYIAISKSFQGIGVKHDSISGNSWVQTPSFTISNNSWAFGGYIHQKWLKPVFQAPKIPRLPSSITQNRLLLQRIVQTPGLTQELAKNRKLLNAVAANPHFANALANNQNLASAIATNKTFAKRLAKERQLRDVVARHPQLANLIASNPDIKDINTLLLQHHELWVVAPLHPDDIMRGLNKENHVQATSSSQILTEDEVKQKVQDNQQHQKQIQHLQNTIREYKLKIRPTEINTGFVYIRLLKYDKDFQLSA